MHKKDTLTGDLPLIKETSSLLDSLSVKVKKRSSKNREVVKQISSSGKTPSLQDAKVKSPKKSKKEYNETLSKLSLSDNNDKKPKSTSSRSTRSSSKKGDKKDSSHKSKV